MKNNRLFQLLYILLEKGSVTAPELARLLEVSVRTVYRDVEALSEAGVPVFATAGKGGGISLMPGSTLSRALLSDEEQDQILFAIQSLKATDQPVDALLSKLGGVFQKRGADWIEVDFSRWGLGRADNRKFELLRSAILEKRVLRILYCGASGETSDRKIKPFKLVFKDKNWYLQAYCLKAGDYRLFKAGRIIELSLTEERFTEAFSDAPPLEGTPGPTPVFTPVRLLFSPAMAFRVYDEFDPYSVEKQPDGSLLVTAPFPPDSWVIGYLLSFGTEVRILEPEALRLRLCALAKKIGAHHET